MTDASTSIDLLVAAGPPQPTDVFRPLADPQRVLVIDGTEPRMIDLATGDIRRFENGTPVTLPMVSLPFDLDVIGSLVVQGTPEPRPTPAPTMVFSLQLADGTIDIESTPHRELRVTGVDGQSVVGSIGEAPAIVLHLERVDEGLLVSARNAETLDRIEITHPLEAGVAHMATLTVGGPSTAVTGSIGRSRSGVVVVHVGGRPNAVNRVAADGLRGALGSARRVAGSVKRRIS